MGIIMPEQGIEPAAPSRCQRPEIRVLVILLIGLAGMSRFALAHPPADAAVTYDENTGNLVVSITHQVDDPATHYVKQVTVRQGDTVLADESYASQPARSLFTYRYNLTQLKGSSGEIRVDAQCSQFGSRSGTLMLTRIFTPHTPGSATTSAPSPAKSPVCACTALVAVGFVATRILR